MPAPAPNPVLPTDWLLGGFRLVGSAIVRPREWDRLTSEAKLSGNKSLADLGAEFDEWTLLVVVLVIQLVFACSAAIALVGLSAVGAALVLEPGLQLIEALRPVLVICGIGLAFGAVTACAISVRAGAAVSVLAPAAAAPLAVLALLAPDAHLGRYGLFSATGEIRALGYVLGGFTLGAAVALSHRYLRADRTAPMPPPTSVRPGTVLANLLLSFILLLAYTVIAYFVLQTVDGREETAWAVTIIALLPLAGILYRQYQVEPRSTWKSYVVAAAPTLALLTFGVGTFAIAYKYVNPAPGHWVERLGVGLLSGALVAGALVFLSALFSPLFPRPDQRGKAATIPFAALLLVFVCALALGAFKNLNHQNRIYSVYGAAAGMVTIWLGSLPLARRPLRVAIAALLALPLSGFVKTSARPVFPGWRDQSAYVGNWNLTGRSEVHAEATVLFTRVKYDKSFTPDFDASVSAGSTSGQLLFTLTHKGKTQRLIGIVQADGTVTFPPGQRSPQRFEGSGFSADLVGTLQQGSASLDSGRLRVRTSWTAVGTVTVGPLTRDVSGTILNDLSGPRR